MPRKPINYDNACIYQFEKDGIIRYVGSTTNFTRRKSQHKTTCNNPNDKNHHSKIYKFIRDNGGWDEFKMILIENFKCNDSNELRAREQHWFNEFKPTLMNDQCPARTLEQYLLDNKVEIATKRAKFRQDNKAKISIIGAKYYQDNRDEIASKVSKYYEDNKVAIAIKKAKYHEDNKEKISMQRAKRYQEKKARKLQLNEIV